MATRCDYRISTQEHILEIEAPQERILPGRMKVKLILIDTFHYTAPPEPPRYFFHGKHIDRFVYSPAECGKVIATDFASSAVAEE